MLGPAEIFTIFFITLGPLKILGPFAQRTHGLDDATVRQIAVRAFLIATISAIAGGFLGAALLAIAMLFARRILVGVTIVILQILGAVLGILQAGLAVQIILRGLQDLQIISA
jgi:small neutral amino acid transporter SnatA (MarC family)